MSGTTELAGPDLTHGISIDEIPDGEMLAGHADGEAVVMVRRGDEVFAIGATCTHYGGPLAEGIVTGEGVHCPWHHACFDIRTGEAVRAPALNPVPVWKVERQGDRVLVKGRKEQAAPAPIESSVASVGIIGAGAAGNACAEMLRRRGFAGQVTMIGAEETQPVDRPNLSKDYLAGNAPEEWIPLRPREFYAEQRIDLITGRRALSLEAKTKTIALDDGTKRSFDAILIATGSEPVHLATPDAQLVHVLRTLSDSRAIIAKARADRRGVILGSSFIGLEVAASLRARDVDVTVISPDAVPLAKVMGPEVGAFIRRLHEEHGVRFRLGTKAKQIEEDRVVLESGEIIPSDFVVAGVGVRPNVTLADEAGLPVDNGIIVDEFLETAIPGIFAAGDVARYPNPQRSGLVRVEHWALAGQHGQRAACNILGLREPFRHVPFFWSAHYDVTINFVGAASGWDHAELHGSLDERRALIAYRTGTQIVAVATIGLDHMSLEAEKALESGDAEGLEKIVERVNDDLVRNQTNT
jgi:NADPH-dependent 2,4-dienoyl-CoA reductase/sulfur reductase-like enzyme/nitrite reductase/ring-hydroxylating ferredoxin subunit